MCAVSRRRERWGRGGYGIKWEALGGDGSGGGGGEGGVGRGRGGGERELCGSIFKSGKRKRAGQFIRGSNTTGQY